MAMEKPVVAEPQRIDKHIKIYQSIDRLREVRDQGNRLVMKITQPDEQKSEISESPPDPCLAEFLNSAGNNIADLAEQISATLSQIKSELF